MKCPYLRRTDRLAYSNRFYLCESPASGSEVRLPTLGELRRFCRTAGGYVRCPAYAKTLGGESARASGMESVQRAVPPP
ncbi:MAG: hypothetical protein ABIH26_06495 [Candidatus Eisenbacteria bacterium]